MMTSTKYCVVWCYREGERLVRRTLYSAKMEPCVEAARLISGNPYSFDVDVLETDTGASLPWKLERGVPIGRVLCAVEG